MVLLVKHLVYKSFEIPDLRWKYFKYGYTKATHFRIERGDRERRDQYLSDMLVMLLKCRRWVNVVMPISLTCSDTRMHICKFKNMAVRALQLFKNSYFSSKSEAMKAVLSA